MEFRAGRGRAQECPFADMDFSGIVESLFAHASMWGYPLVFLLMAVESSFIPFPSEVVMIPAGFLAARGALSLGIPEADLALALIAGLLGALAGAYVNYFLAACLGEPLLRRYGKYLFLKPEVLERSQEIFREYGGPATFVCRLLPVVRQYISLPAGLSRMPFASFTLYTALGAGIWNAILAGAGYWIGHSTADLTPPQLVTQGKAMVTSHFGWILLGIALFLAAYVGLSRWVLKDRKAKTAESEDAP